MTTRTTRIGFVGLGRMGGNMTARLLGAGYTVYGTNRTRERARRLIVEDGLRWCDTPRQVADAADVVFSSLPDDDAIEAVTAGSDGLLAGLAAGNTWIDVSTVSPSLSRHLASRVRESGARRLDAPVSGSVPQVQAGTLTIMVGGNRDAYERVAPILRELGTPTRVGDNGQAQVLKLAINISLGAQMLALAEGLLLAEHAGLDPGFALGLMTDSAIGSPMLKARAPIVLDPPDEAWFDIALLAKDMELARDAGREMRVPLPAADRTAEILAAARKLGYERQDIAALFQVLERLSGPEARAA